MRRARAWGWIATLALGGALACEVAVQSGGSADTTATPPASSRVVHEDAPPAGGRLHGRDFRVEGAAIEGGILSLRQGEDFFADRELMVFLFLDDREIPAGRRFEVGSVAQRGSLTPHLHLKWRDDVEQMPDTHIVMNDYRMTLEFGDVTGRTLPGWIELEIPGQPATRVSGGFEAAVKGLILDERGADLGVDSFDVLRYVAERYVVEHRPGTRPSALEFGNDRFSHADPERPALQVGSIEVRVPDAVNGPTLWRLQFAKRDGAWQVERRLSHAQLVDAHPIEIPAPDARPWERFRYVMARVLESELAPEAASQGVYDAEFSSSYEPQGGLGEGRASYRVGSAGEPVERRFLFEKRDRGWALVRELAADESI